MDDSDDLSEDQAVFRDPRSKAKYNIFSRILFLWVEPLFWLGSRGSIASADLYVHPTETDSAALLEQFKRHWNGNVFQRDHSLFVVLFMTLWWRIALQALLQVLEKCLLVGQSITLGYLTDYFREPCSQNSTEPYLLVMALSLMAFGMVLLYTHGSLTAQKTGMMARIMCTAAIYEKVTNTDQTTISLISSGNVINLASNDVQRLDYAFLFLHYLWLGPLYVIVYTYLVYQEVGPAAFLATAFVVIQIPLQMVLAKLFAFFKQYSSEKTDERVSAMKEVISAMKVIKMYTWEGAFNKIIQTLRMQESQSILKSSLIRAANFAIFTVSLTFITFLVFSVYTGTGGVLSPRKVFTILSLTASLRVSSIHFFVLAILNLSDTIVAMTRIQNMLEMGSPEQPSPTLAIGQQDNAIAGSVLVENLSISWDTATTANPVLSNITFEVPKGRHISIIGSVGSGKSTLLQCLLGELKPTEGTVTVKGKVSYASQNPWVFSGTLRENILFGNIFDKEWYNTVVQACALDKDFAEFLQGDMVVIGDKGASLSGGQRARVCLARAVYHKADVYILDDPLSAVDTAVARHIFENCICGVLRQNTVVLVTNQLQFVHKMEQIIALNSGRMAACCTPQQLKEKDIDPSKLLDIREDDEFLYKNNGEDEDEEEQDKEQQPVIQERQRKVSSGIQTLISESQRKRSNAIQPSNVECTEISVTKESVISGRPTRVSTEQYGAYLHVESLATRRPSSDHSRRVSTGRRPSNFDRPLRISTGRRPSNFDRPLRVSTGRRPSNFDRPLRVSTGRRPSNFESTLDPFVNTTSKISILSVLSSFSQRKSITSIYSNASSTSAYSGMDEDGDSDMEENADLFTEERSTNRVSIRTYFNYFRAGGNLIILIALIGLFILGEGSSIAADVWIAQWTGYNSSCSNSTYAVLPVRERVAVYGAITASTIVLNFARIIVLFLVAHRAAATLHDRMLSSLLGAVPWLFDVIPIGQILNRFAKDMGFLDELLPFMLCEYLILLLRCIAVVLTAASANYWIFIPASILIVALLVLRTYYLRTATQIKWLESNARSPVYNHLSATLDGLVTIRIFAQQSRALQDFHGYQNEHSKAWYLQLVATRWFGMRVDAISSLLITLVAIISVPLSMELDAAIVGLGLTYTLTLAGSLQYCIRLSGDVENVMMSAERVSQYSRLLPEEPLNQTSLPACSDLPPEWPQSGEITLEDVSFRYSPRSPLVLKSISCHIMPAEKIGIVGRTGAGKSSLISMFFRLAQPQGIITVDGMNINELDLHKMRCRLSIIPQEPVLFSGTVRYNLDPMDMYSDAELWSVLEKVQLKSTIELIEGGLDGFVSENGCNFSIGQRQLICLARALLKRSKILVIDEATANVDVRTDGIIQALIRDNFSDCTVLTIAHRLNTIMDSDRIMVLNRGHIKEFGRPYLLLKDRASLFRKMVKQTGHTAAQKLQRMAYEAYLKKNVARRESVASTLLLESIEETDVD